MSFPGARERPIRMALVHCNYRHRGGEDQHVEQLQDLLAASPGLEVRHYSRASAELLHGRFGAARTALSCFWNPRAVGDLLGFCRDFSPDILHLHNLYPVIPPAVLGRIKRRGIRLVMTLHNYRLICPNALLLSAGRVCTRCLGGHELQCVWRNCEDSYAKSLVYALRGMDARVRGHFVRSVDLFLALTRFQRDLIGAQIGRTQDMRVIGSFIADAPVATPLPREGPVVFIGRMSREKAPDLLLRVARRMPGQRFVFAGAGPLLDELRRAAPSHASFVGQLERPALGRLLGQARVVVCPSRWYEGLPTVILEAFAAGRPCILSDLGGMREIVEETGAGLCFRSDDAEDLCTVLTRFLSAEEFAEGLGRRARAAIDDRFNPNAYRERLLAAYDDVMTRGDRDLGVHWRARTKNR